MRHILMLYTSKTGTTLHATDIIAQVFKDKGYEVTVKNLKDNINLELYDGVIIGAPINGMQWHPDGTNFVTNNQEVLKEKVTAFFFMSYILNHGHSFWHKIISSSLKKVKAMVDPVEIGRFNGKIDKKFPTIPRWLFGIKKDTPMDLSNDEMVKAWAVKCAELFSQ